jgi:hypothetical protein
MTVNRLILGDNLEILKVMESESVDLYTLIRRHIFCTSTLEKASLPFI